MARQRRVCHLCGRQGTSGFIEATPGAYECVKTPQCVKRQKNHQHENHVHIGADPHALAEHTANDQPVAAGADPAALAKATAPDGNPVDTSQVVADAAARTLLLDLYSTSQARAQVVQAIEDADERLRQLVRSCFAQGVTVRPMMDATGLSKSRIYQLRDGRR